MAKGRKKRGKKFESKKAERHLRRGSHGRGRRGMAAHFGGVAKKSRGHHRGKRKSGRKSRKSYRK